MYSTATPVFDCGYGVSHSMNEAGNVVFSDVLGTISFAHPRFANFDAVSGVTQTGELLLDLTANSYPD